ncbi:MAG: phosphoribosylamine--glycine ligase, partial [Candidatus Zixiibacteriota bacterium]
MAGAKVLVIGSGGREHALAWKLKQSRKVERVYCAPGNAGIGQVASRVRIKPENIRGLVDFAKRQKIDLTVVGPEKPLAMGIADEFRRRKLRIFGPDRKGARIESSKVFAKQFMQKYHIPTAPFRVFETFAEALGFCKSIEYPTVLKADGLAAGKGVIIAHDYAEAAENIEEIMVKKRFGSAGARLVIESFLRGQEVSIMIVTDGKTFVELLPSQDHKQLGDGDTGPNTGGMGAYCPADFVGKQEREQIRDFIIRPLLSGLQAENINYRGVIYAGLMLTADGPKVLEFNCRFGDPETQAVLPLLQSDLYTLLKAAADRRLARLSPPKWRSGAAACVVMASKGYPGQYTAGKPIEGLNQIK